MTFRPLQRSTELTQLVALFLLCATLAYAQPAPPSPLENTSPLEEMRTLLREGLYALAAQVEGPELVQELPDNAEAHYLYSRALYLTGDLATAETQLGEVRSLGESRAKYAQLGALIAAAQGDFSRAQALLEAAFEQTPSYDVAMDLGRVAWQAGDFERALRAYEAAAATPRGENEPWPYLHLGRLLALSGNYEESVKAWNSALNVLDALSLAAENSDSALPSPAYVEAFFGLGEAYEALGELEQAAANYDAALAADPSFEPATEALVRLNEAR